MKNRLLMDEHYMAIALEEAQSAAQKGEVPVGAVIVIDGEPVGKGHNLCESSKDPTAHAEIVAIQRACRAVDNWRLAGATLYVTVEPCLMCAGAIHLARIARVVFGCPDSKGGALISLHGIARDKRLKHSLELYHGVMEDRCSMIIKDFFRRLRESGKERYESETASLYYKSDWA